MKKIVFFLLLFFLISPLIPKTKALALECCNLSRCGHPGYPQDPYVPRVVKCLRCQYTDYYGTILYRNEPIQCPPGQLCDLNTNQCFVPSPTPTPTPIIYLPPPGCTSNTSGLCPPGQVNCPGTFFCCPNESYCQQVTPYITPAVGGVRPEPCEVAGNLKGGIKTALGCIPTADPQAFVGWLLGRAIGIAGGIAFLMMIVASFQIITSTGNPERLQGGKELLGSALAGLLFIIFSIYLLQLIGVRILQIPGF